MFVRQAIWHRVAALLMIVAMGPVPTLAHGPDPVERPSPALLRYLRDDMRRAVGADAAAVDPAMRHAPIKVAILPPTRRHGRLFVLALAAFFLAALAGSQPTWAQLPEAAPQSRQPARVSHLPSPALMRYLRRYMRQHFPTLADESPDNKALWIDVAVVPLPARRLRLYVVYFSGRSWCGTGGCSLRVFESRGATFRKVGGAQLVQLPTELLPTRHHGYPDIGVTVKVNDYGPDHEPAGVDGRLVFDGRHYPLTATEDTPRHLHQASRGRVLIDDVHGGQEGALLTW